MKNRQYAYTKPDNFVDVRNFFGRGRLLIYHVQGIQQENDNKIKPQDNTPNFFNKNILLSTIVVKNTDDKKLIDKIQKEIHKTEFFQETPKEIGRDCSLVEVRDIAEHLKIYDPGDPSTLDNQDFLNHVEKRITDAKTRAIKKILGRQRSLWVKEYPGRIIFSLNPQLSA